MQTDAALDLLQESFLFSLALFLARCRLIPALALLSPLPAAVSAQLALSALSFVFPIFFQVVPCTKPATPPSETPCDDQQLLLQPLLRAHEEEVVASQKLCLDAPGLLQTFEPLLKLVREMQHIEVCRVELTDTVPELMFLDVYQWEKVHSCGDDYGWRCKCTYKPRNASTPVGVQELPASEDLRGIKEQLRELHVCSQQLTELLDSGSASSTASRRSTSMARTWGTRR